MKSLSVSIQVGGGFHAFRLAEQLNNHNVLESITTTYPYSVFDYFRPESIPRAKFKTVPTLLIEQLVRRTPLLRRRDFSWYINELFDTIASLRLADPGIFVGWPGSSLRGIQRANKNGITTVVDADAVNITSKMSSIPELSDLHIPTDPGKYVFQKLEIEKEYQCYGISSSPVNEKYIEKTLKEYVATDYIVVPTQYVYDAMISIGIDETKLKKVPFGVDTEIFQPTEEDYKRDTFQILYVGQVHLRKGIQYLLEAVDELNYSDIELLIVGDIQDNSQFLLEEYEGEYRHISHVPHHQLRDYYTKSDVFVFPSVLEGFGMVIPEAMACGLPVITTTHTGGVELIDHGENGFLISPRDVEGIKKYIKYVYENRDEAQRIGDNARKTVEKRDWDDYGDEMVDFYKESLKYN